MSIGEWSMVNVQLEYSHSSFVQTPNDGENIFHIGWCPHQPKQTLFSPMPVFNKYKVSPPSGF